MKKIFIVLLMTIIFYACNNIVEPIEFNENDLCGLWKNDSHSIEFFAGSNFVDSTFDCNCDTSLPKREKLLTVLNGTYSISNNILKYNNLCYTFMDTSIHSYQTSTYFLQVNIKDDSLIMEEMYEFDRISSESYGLIGTWEMIRANIHRLDDTFNYTIGSKDTYKILKKTIEYAYEAIFVYPKESKIFYVYDYYVYQKPYLSLSGGEKFKTEINENKMYWYFNRFHKYKFIHNL